MKVVGLNNKEYNLNLKNYIVMKDDQTKKSSLHMKARELISELFCGYTILEEVKLPGSRDPSKKSVLFLDFFIPNAMLGIEVNGKQHYEYVPYFHKSKAGFLSYLHKDSVKKDWCDLNNIDLIVLKYSDPIEVWRDQIERR